MKVGRQRFFWLGATLGWGAKIGSDEVGRYDGVGQPEAASDKVICGVHFAPY